jgi:hypothetical protein
MSAYHLLLRILPKTFREEFGPEMSAVFEEQRRRTSNVAGLWLEHIAAVTRRASTFATLFDRCSARRPSPSRRS